MAKGGNAAGKWGLAASLDADSKDADGAMREGAFYVWTPAEIEAALGDSDEAVRFCACYDITARGKFRAFVNPKFA